MSAIYQNRNIYRSNLDKNISKNDFDLLHIGTWGPFVEPTVDNSKYFLTIVDDFSRATWVFLVRAKSDVLKYSLTLLRW